MTCPSWGRRERSGSPGCGWRGSSPRSARLSCDSAWLRPASCSLRRGWSCPRPRWGCCTSRRRGGRRGYGWPPCCWAGPPGPAGLELGFSGSDRTVAEYLLAEVLERQSPEVRRLLLRTSVLERVSGPLADALTGGADGELILQELEQ